MTPRTLKRILVGMALAASWIWAVNLGWILRDGDVASKGATIRALDQRVGLVEEERDFWRNRALGAHETILRTRQRIVEVTAYTASRSECDRDPHIAASMQAPRPGTVAVSRDLFDMGWTFGKRVYLKGLGPYTINDVMNERYQMRVDVFMGHRRQAREFGVRTTEAILG